eukprot:1194720-Prorocentrum_minimum.AAC.10
MVRRRRRRGPQPYTVESFQRVPGWIPHPTEPGVNLVRRTMAELSGRGALWAPVLRLESEAFRCCPEERLLSDPMPVRDPTPAVWPEPESTLHPPQENAVSQSVGRLVGLSVGQFASVAQGGRAAPAPRNAVRQSVSQLVAEGGFTGAAGGFRGAEGRFAPDGVAGGVHGGEVAEGLPRGVHGGEAGEGRHGVHGGHHGGGGGGAAHHAGLHAAGGGVVEADEVVRGGHRLRQLRPVLPQVRVVLRAVRLRIERRRLRIFPTDDQ